MEPIVTDEPLRPYPGASATASEIFALACEFHSAAEALVPRRRACEPVSRAPARFCAIHAVELYLNAFLLTKGDTHREIRARFHNLSSKAERARDMKLVLRKLTFDHLVTLTDNREYLISRYAPEMSATVTQDNRLMATLNEVAKKVKVKVLLLGDFPPGPP